MTTEHATFGASFGSIFFSGVRGYFSNIIPLTLAGALTIGTYFAFRVPAQSAFVDDNIAGSLALDMAGLLLASILAFPWYCYALNAVDGEGIDVGFPFRKLGRFGPQIVASFWFWAAVLLGLRYLLGIPSILAVLFYAFYGFAIADGAEDSGMRALGYSVRLGEGKRIGLAALAGVFLVFNIFGAIAVGYEVTALTIGLAIAGVVVTTNITLVAGARVYRQLQSGLKRSR